MTSLAVIGLGSNLNRPLMQLREACARLKNTASIDVQSYSCIYQSTPLVPDNAPTDWSQHYYLNAAVKIKTTLSPLDLLAVLKKIEHAMGRQSVERWSPRVIDLDILIYDDLDYSSDHLTIPHRELKNRSFAVLPLLDVHDHAELASIVWKDRPTRLPHLLNNPQIMGILNATPDSFSDGGQFTLPDQALHRAQYLFHTGADIIDIGCESTRPGATLIDSDQEWQRLEPILQVIYEHWHDQQHRPLISIDTRHAAIIKRAIDYGIDWVNDVSQEESEQMLPLIQQYDLRYVVMHHCGLPVNANQVLDGDVIEVLKKYQTHWCDIIRRYDLMPEQLIVDPGIGFGKTHEQHLTLIQHMNDIKIQDVQLLIGHSRKSFLKKIIISDEPLNREIATAVLSAQFALSGADYLRVHEPSINLDAIRCSRYIKGSKGND